ncbi:D-alanyl-D-alanine carboxypeptidase [Clostridium sp. D2Q-14]|uniref:D-alanyl-D-alanine carboxypeptidase family protein n=1 Tax=Anaeromonas gelatinilytica TaxID=2683194 RepID=UPI00193C497B|nr:D-alanyl-D-alanine carboxypeptidase family protein [Anaeromonas gelatinilytica]MBS4536232.1 D-alanyl-D-alanine carboxypeptidase [Anaeromonas gelatinilytica]
MFKKIISLILILVISILILPQSIFANEPFNVDGKAALLMDFNSGEVIYEKNSNEKLPPASITKIMVLILIMEALEDGKINLDDNVSISENAASMGGSQVFLEPKGINSVEELLKAICLRSANDASVAMGEHLAGSEELFLDQMNARAKELNMENTHFTNLTGLPDEEHYTTAYDIALMGRELLTHKSIHKWLSMWMTTIKVGKDKDVEQELVNTNKLIRFYPGANGIKTGFTQEAGYCLAASATRENSTFISVILGSESSKQRNEDSKKLLDYAFANYKSVKLYNKDDIVGNIMIEKGKTNKVPVKIKNDINLLLEKSNNEKIDKEININKSIKAPIIKGQKVGEIDIKLNNESIITEDLIIDDNIEKANVINIFKELLISYSTK